MRHPVSTPCCIEDVLEPATHTQADGPLATQQQALLRALFARPGRPEAGAADETIDGEPLDLLDAGSAQTQRGLQAYQANGHALAERSLGAAYPVITALIGADNFARLARDIWHSHPPTRGDMALWGDALPDFLQASEQLADVPYLADVARVEWALHRAASAADARPDPASFARLGTEAPEGLVLTLSPGTALLGSPFPVASLVTAHLQDEPPLDEAARRLREGRGEHALVWRQGLRPRVGAVHPAAAALIQRLLDGSDLPQALDAAGACGAAAEAFDFSTWLTTAVTDGLVTGVHRLTAADPNAPTQAPLP